MTSSTRNGAAEDVGMLQDYDAVCLADEGTREFLRTILDEIFA